MPKIMKKVPYVIPFFLRKTHPEVNCQKLKSTMPKKKKYIKYNIITNLLKVVCFIYLKFNFSKDIFI